MLRSPSTRGQVKSSVIVSPVSGNASGSRPAGEIGPKSTISARPPPGGVTTMKPIPPSPLFHGSRTASAKAVATTASTALPPAASISAPTAAATPFCAATMPPRDAATGFLTTQFCISGGISQHLDRIDPALVEGIVPGEARGFVIGHAVAPDGVLRLAAIDLDGPVRAVALERAIGLVLGRTHEVEPHVLFRNVRGRRMAGFLNAQRRLAVGDHGAGKADAHPPGFGHEIDPVLGFL